MERRKFTREFKIEAVKLLQERGVTVAQAARDLGVHGTVLRRPVESAQYTSEPFQRLLVDHGVTCSMSRSGNCWDNAALRGYVTSPISIGGKPTSCYASRQ